MKGWGALVRWVVPFLMGGALGSGVTYYLSQQPGERAEAEYTSSFVRPFQAVPQDMAAFPCTRRTRFENAFSPCLLISAGGKRLIFGAPMSQDWRGIGYVDAAFLMNGHPVSSGGVMGLRSETWQDGRKSGLLVIGDDIEIDRLMQDDANQSSPDAVLKLERPAELNYLEASLRPKPVPGSARDYKVFDTGDLQVFATQQHLIGGATAVSYLVQYDDIRIEILPCGAEPVSGRVDYIISPSVEVSELASQQYEAQRARLTARSADIQRVGRLCPDLKTIQSYIVRAGAEGAVLLRRDYKIGTAPDADALENIRVVDASGLSLSGLVRQQDPSET